MSLSQIYKSKVHLTLMANTKLLGDFEPIGSSKLKIPTHATLLVDGCENVDSFGKQTQ